MKNPISLLCYLIIFLCGCSVGHLPNCKDVQLSEKKVVFTIMPAQNHKDQSMVGNICFSFKEPISLACTFHNTSQSTAYLELNELSQSGTQHKWPPGIQVMLADASDTILTTGSSVPDFITNGRFWSSVFLESQLENVDLSKDPCCPGATDCITLGPGQSLKRIVILQEILSGCRNISFPLPVGKYTVQMRKGAYYSNEMPFTIVP